MQAQEVRAFKYRLTKNNLFLTWLHKNYVYYDAILIFCTRENTDYFVAL